PLGPQGLGPAAGLEFDGDARLVLGALLDHGADAEPQAALRERLLGGLGELLVLDGQHPGQRLDHRNIWAQRPVETGEWYADRARSDDAQRLGAGLREHRLAVGLDTVAVRLEADGRDGAGPGAGGENDVLRLDRTRAALLQRHRHLGGQVALLQLRLALDHLDLVLLHQEADAGVELGVDLARALDHAGEVEAAVLGGEAVVPQVTELLIDLAALEQRLGGDAAPVEAYPAERLALDDRGLEAELG